MKKAVFIGLVLLAALRINVYSQKDKAPVKVKPDTVAVDSIEYKLVVLDPGFDAWLATKPPEEFYSKEYYEIRNREFVIEWNNRYMNQSRYGNLYDAAR